ncbi:MAG: hypothetical protein Q8O67_14330 [Deltaproteobacteria bacterium]|nr:hypothetical protein [Deltaproteobacteria bacterium]
MRKAVAVAVVVVVVAASCSGSEPPSAAVEKAARALYAGQLGGRDAERDAMRLQGTEKLKGAMAAIDASCQEILGSDLPNHGLRGDAIADFDRTCLAQGPLSCGNTAATLTAVESIVIAGDGASAVAKVTPTGAANPVSVELGFKVVDGAWKLDEVACR